MDCKPGNDKAGWLGIRLGIGLGLFIGRVEGPKTRHWYTHGPGHWAEHGAGHGAMHNNTFFSFCGDKMFDGLFELINAVGPIAYRYMSLYILYFAIEQPLEQSYDH